MSEAMRYEDFLARQASRCDLRLGVGDAAEAAFQAMLSEVGERKERQGFENFMLLFRAEPAGAPQQGMHVVTFTDGVQQEIFLVPVARAGEQVDYEAIFNRAIVT